MNTNKNTHLSFASSSRLCLVALLVCAGWFNSSAAIRRWNGGGGNDNWNTSGNWSASGVPGSVDDAWFGNFDTTGLAGPSGTANSIIDASLTVKSLWFTNTTSLANQVHTIEIPSGNTLTITGGATDPVTGASQAMLVGMTVEVGADPTNYTTIKGAGTLTVNSAGNITVRVPGSSGLHRGTLDLSGLNSFNASINQLLVGGDGNASSSAGTAMRRSWGTMTMAKTNVVTLAASPAMIIGGYTAANFADGVLKLGQTNVFLTDGEVYVGTYRSSGLVQFDPANANPVAVFRGLNGVSRASNWLIGHNRGFGATAGKDSFGTVDLSGGTVDAMISSLVVGRGQNYNNSVSVATARGDLAISKGVLDVLDLNIGQRRQNYAAPASGSVTVGNTAQLIVRDYIEIGLDRLTDPTNVPCSGTLSITNGGFVWCKGDMYDSGAGTNIVNVNGGHLKVGGYLTHPSSRPFDEFDLTNATLTLTLSSANSYTNPVGSVTNLNIALTNIINVQGGGLSLGQYPLIRYYGAGIGGDGFGVVSLGSQPSRSLGYLSNNVANASIDYVLTNVSAAKWDGTINGDWNISQTANWVDQSSSTATTYLENTPPGDAVIFDDSATGTTTVTLVTNVSPVLISFTNSSKAYAFGGSGKISGTAQLNKNGNGVLVITNTGANDFSGGVNLNAGTLRLGLATNRLPVAAQVSILPGTLLDLGGQFQQLISVDGGGDPSAGEIQLNGGYLNLTGGTTYGGHIDLGTGGTLGVNASSTFNGNISGAGVFLKNAGTLTMSGSNIYSGGTVLVSGTTSLINPTGSGLGTGPVVNLGTLNVGNGAEGGLVSSVNVTNFGTLNFNGINDTSLAGIHGSGAVTKNNTNTVTIVGPGSYTGVTTVTDGGVRILDGTGLGDTVGATSIGNGANARVELQGGITVFENFGISMKPGAAGKATHFVNVSGNNFLTGTITGSSGGSYWTFRSDAGKLTVNGAFVNNAPTGTRTLRLLGVAEGEFATPFPTGVPTRVRKEDPGTWTLSAINTYNGDTYVYGGKLVVNGEIQSLTTVWVGDVSFDFSCTLAGTGVIASAVFVDTNGVFSPGDTGIGTLTINNTLTMQPGSTNVFNVNTDTLEHDRAAGMTAVAYGGTLIINPSGLGTAVTNGASAQLFSAASYSGAFGAIVPTTPGPGLVWDTSQLTVDGTLKITTPTLVDTTPTNLTFAVVGNALDISWPANQTGWRLEGQTNGLDAGISNNWFTVPGSATTNHVILPLNFGPGSVFYRLIYP